MQSLELLVCEIIVSLQALEGILVASYLSLHHRQVGVVVTAAEAKQLAAELLE